MSIKEIITSIDNVYREDNLFYQKNASHGAQFEKHYLELREKENRLYTDDLVKNLPKIPRDHPLRSEWVIRKNSADKLIHYLIRRGNANSILEVGCGNGWLSNRLAQELHVEICGIDINEIELKQAARLFGEHSRISFIYADVWEPLFPPPFFDVIVLPSSAQYFPDLRLLIRRLIEFTTPQGEIHILDTPFYRSGQELQAARKRSHDYFTSLSSAPMGEYYFHHTFDELKDFDTSIMYNPKSWSSQFQRRILRAPLSPFPWIRIKGR